MKKVFLIALGTLLSVSIIFGVAYANGAISIVVNGKPISSDVEPRMINNRVMVPISFVSKALGADVTWDQKTQTVGVNSYGITPVDVWKDDMSSMGRFEVAGINNTVQVFMAGMDQGDEALISKSVTNEMDVDSLKLQHYSMGPTMFSTQIEDIRLLKVKAGQPLEYQVRVVVQTWFSEITLDYWDLIIVENIQYDENKMPYSVKRISGKTSTQVNEHRVFPGYNFKF